MYFIATEKNKWKIEVEEDTALEDRRNAAGFKHGRRGHQTRKAGSLQKQENARKQIFL